MVVGELCLESLSNHGREEGSLQVSAVMAAIGEKEGVLGVVRSRCSWYGKGDDERVEALGEVRSLESDVELYGRVGVLAEG